MRDYDDAFMWLKDSRIVNVCHNADEPNVALKGRGRNNILACLYGDNAVMVVRLLHLRAFAAKGLLAQNGNF